VRVFQPLGGMIFLWATEDGSSDAGIRFRTTESEGLVILSFLQNLYLANKYL
jgi:hypothetical protein